MSLTGMKKPGKRKNIPRQTMDAVVESMAFFTVSTTVKTSPSNMIMRTVDMHTAYTKAGNQLLKPTVGSGVESCLH